MFRQFSEADENYFVIHPTGKKHNNKFNPLDSKRNYSATSNNTKLVHW